jgi:hypothetical protein
MYDVGTIGMDIITGKIVPELITNRWRKLYIWYYNNTN